MEIVALAALALAAFFGVLVWKLLRDERRRADARVASLTAALEGRADLPLIVPVDDDSAAFRAFGRESDGGDHLRRLVALAPLALVVLVGVGYLRFGRSDHPAPQLEATKAAVAPAAAPLELLALTHTQRDGVLHVRGVVRNPRTAPVRLALEADVTLLDATGQSLGAERTSLLSTALRPGEDSAFVVSLPWRAGVQRYRVTFRKPDGPAVPHVDRRASPSTEGQ